MYKIKELFLAAFQNQRRRKKYTRTVFFLMFLSMAICIGVNSIVISIDGGIRNVTDKPLGKLIQIMDYSGDDSMLNEVRDKLGDLDITGDIIRLVPFMEATWHGTEDILYSESAEVNLLAYFNGIGEYGMSGKYAGIERGEVLIPEYLYGIGDYSLYEYTSGSLLIGKEIEISIHNIHNDRNYPHTFKIVGTYDNINSSCVNNFFFINDAQADEIYAQTYEDHEIEIEKIKELYKEELEEGQFELVTDIARYIGVYVKNHSDVKEMEELIEEATDGYGSGVMQVPDDSLLQYFQMILDICRIVVLMLLAVAFANLLITALAELKQRNGEIAVDFAMGYSQGDIIVMFALEKAIMLFWAGFAAFLFTGAGILGGNYFIQTCLPFYRRTIVLEYDWGIVGSAFLILVFASVVSLVLTAVQIRRFNLAEVMKSEWAKM